MINQTNRSGASNGAGLMLVALGVFFLLAQFLDFNVWGFAWPFMIIIPGLLFFVAMLAGGPALGALAIPGSIITTIGLILLYQSTFDHFESWSYAWALIPTAVGIGIIIDGRRRADPTRVAGGGRMVRIGLTMFLIGFAFFELLLNISGFFGGWAGHSIGPLLLIAAGIYLFFTQRVPGGRPVTRSTDVTAVGVDQEPAFVSDAVEHVEEPVRTSEAAVP